MFLPADQYPLRRVYPCCAPSQNPSRYQAAGRNQHIIRLDNAMDEALIVSMCERGTNLARKFDNPLYTRPGCRTKRAAFDKLHHNEWNTIGLAGIKNCDNIGMVQRGYGARLSQQARTSLAAHIGRRDHFDGDRAVEYQIEALIDDPYAAASQLGISTITIQQCFFKASANPLLINIPGFSRDPTGKKPGLPV